ARRVSRRAQRRADRLHAGQPVLRRQPAERPESGQFGKFAEQVHRSERAIALRAYAPVAARPLQPAAAVADPGSHRQLALRQPVRRQRQSQAGHGGDEQLPDQHRAAVERHAAHHDARQNHRRVDPVRGHAMKLRSLALACIALAGCGSTLSTSRWNGPVLTPISETSRDLMRLPLAKGKIVAYEQDVRTGGIGVRYFGVGASDQFRTDQVTVNLRAVDIRTGRILVSVSTTKTVYSLKVSADVFRFVSFKRLLEAETGYTTNEPAQLAVRDAIEAAVIHLIIQGARENHW